MGEQHRLSPLQVGIAGHHHIEVSFPQAYQRALHTTQSRHGVGDGGTGVQTHIQRDLIVAGAAGMQAATGRADQVGQPPLNIHVQVFEVRVPREFALFDLFLHPAQAGDDGVGVFLADDALFGEHGRMGFRAGNIFPI